MGSFGLINTCVLFAYLAVMIGVGFFFSRRQTSTEEYFLAGRRMPWLVVGMSMFASVTSALTYLGVPGLAYAENTAVFFGVLISPIVVPILVRLFYPYYRRLNVTTSYEYINMRYGPTARLVVSGLFILSRLAWLGIVIYSPALALHSVTGINLYLAIVLMGILATVYTVLGGLSAVLWTDALQFIILVGGAVWLALDLCAKVPNGASGILSAASQHEKLATFDWRLNPFEFTAIGAMISWFFVFMHDYGVDQVTVQRLMATRDMKATTRAVLFNAFSDIFINALLLFIGLGLYAYYLSHLNQPDGGLSKDMVMPAFIMKSFPTGISGLLITAIFAAAMSSMDSGINSISTVLVSDVVKPLRKNKLTDQAGIRLARILTLVLGLLATGAAFYASTIGSIVKAWSSFMSLFSGSILAIFLLGMLLKRATFAGWCVGCVVSIGVTLYLQNYPIYGNQQLHWVWYMPVSFGVCFITGWIVSLILPQKKV